MTSAENYRETVKAQHRPGMQSMVPIGAGPGTLGDELAFVTGWDDLGAAFEASSLDPPIVSRVIGHIPWGSVQSFAATFGSGSTVGRPIIRWELFNEVALIGTGTFDVEAYNALLLDAQPMGVQGYMLPMWLQLSLAEGATTDIGYAVFTMHVKGAQLRVGEEVGD